MKIEERKENILKAVVEEYIEVAEPVSSGNIIKKYPIGLSSATVRNEMAELEKLGLLEKPYSSSGRIPSELGYRYYVDKLIQEAKLSKKEVENIRDMLQVNGATLQEVLNTASTTLSELTHYTSIAVTPDLKEDKIKDIDFLLLGERNLMIVIFTECGVIKESIIKFEDKITKEVVEDLKYIFKRKMIGRLLVDIDGKVEDYLLEEVKVSLEIIERIVYELNRILEDDERIFFKGPEKTLKLPELKDSEAVGNFLELVEDKEKFEKIFSENDNNDQGITVYIGGENKDSKLKGYSVITFTNKKGNKDYGTIGIIGPTRMNYSKVMAIMKQIITETNKNEEGEKGGRENE